MCWNKEVSIATYITVMVMVVILFRRNIGADRHLALFSAAFVTIQLMEFFAWMSIEKKDRKLNDLITRLILIFLWAQPLINSYMAFKGTSNLFSKYILILAVIIFFILFMAAVATSLRGFTFSTTTGPNCHLVWNRKSSNPKFGTSGETPFMSDFKIPVALYLLGLFIPLLFIKPFKKGVFLSLVGFGLLLLSRKFSAPEEFSSWWCWIAGVFTLAAIVLKA